MSAIARTFLSAFTYHVMTTNNTVPHSFIKKIMQTSFKQTNQSNTSERHTEILLVCVMHQQYVIFE